MKQMNRAKKRYFDYLQREGKMPKSEENDMPGYAYGGMVEDEEDDFDYMEGHAHEFDSSGEPHTEDKFEDEQPMEFMSRGGRVKRMSRGGMVPHPSFTKALRKAM